MDRKWTVEFCVGASDNEYKHIGMEEINAKSSYSEFQILNCILWKSRYSSQLHARNQHLMVLREIILNPI